MAKRKLTKQQKRRIRASHERRHLEQPGLTEEFDNSGLGPEQAGVVVSHFGSQVDVEAADGETRRCHFRANLPSLVTGDEVVWRDAEPTGVVVALQPRHSVLQRPDPYGDMKIIASNVDLIVIVCAPKPEFHANLIDRYLVAAEQVGITPLIVLNKTDLLEADQASHSGILAQLQAYRDIGYSTLLASCYREQGLDALADALARKTSVLVGQSGVGKSSLINRLIPDLELKTGALSDSSDKGTHTTTYSRLLHLPNGGQVIDSPGIREFGLWHMDKEQLLAGFIEFRPFLGHCRFRDCQHEQEPGCALLEALQQRRISAQRFNSFRQILLESGRS